MPYRASVGAASLADAVAPLWAGEGASRALLAPCTLVACEGGVVAVTSSAAIPHPRPPLSVGTHPETGDTARVLHTSLARYLGATALCLEHDAWSRSVVPISHARVGTLALSSEVAFSAIGIEAQGDRWRRVELSLDTRVERWASRGGAGDDREATYARVTTPSAGLVWIDGAAVIAHWPASRALGLPAEARVVGIACVRRPVTAHDVELELVPIDVPSLTQARAHASRET